MSEYREIRGSLQGERCEHKSWTDLCERCEIDRLRAGNEALLAANRDVMLHWDVLKSDYDRLRKALQDIKELPGEINPYNYDHDDVVALNNSFCEAFEIASAALGENND